MDSFATMVTPYRADGSVDLDAAERIVQWYYDKGLTGVFAVCQSSEIFFLTVEEREALAQRVYRKAKALERSSTRRFTVVSSGHVSDDPAAQADELNRICRAGIDALILITNRLDPENAGDDVFIANAVRLLAQLPPNVPLGLYECPYPYKRLVTPKILDWCLSTGRFAYMKDTCCDAALIAQRCAQMRGSGFKLLNANCQTLLQTLRSGVDGYCGVMANFHPALYAWLCENGLRDPERAEAVQALLGTCGFTEGGLPYPITAKYSLSLEGIDSALIARSRPGETLTDYAKDCVRQMKALCDRAAQQLGIG